MCRGYSSDFKCLLLLKYHEVSEYVVIIALTLNACSCCFGFIFKVFTWLSNIP